jgi:hypothetical protein
VIQWNTRVFRLIWYDRVGHAFVGVLSYQKSSQYRLPKAKMLFFFSLSLSLSLLFTFGAVKNSGGHRAQKEERWWQSLQDKVGTLQHAEKILPQHSIHCFVCPRYERKFEFKTMELTSVWDDKSKE